jgi:hypothetical protein
MMCVTTGFRVSVLLSALALLAACSDKDPATRHGDSTTPSVPISDLDQRTDAATTDIRMLIAGRPVRAELADNSTARALVNQRHHPHRPLRRQPGVSRRRPARRLPRHHGTRPTVDSFRCGPCSALRTTEQTNSRSEV